MIVPKYTKQEFVKTPQIDFSAPSPARLQSVYENNLSRAGKLLPDALNTLSSAAGKFSGKGTGGAVSLPQDADAQLRLREHIVSAARDEISRKGKLDTAALEAFASKNFMPETASGEAGRDWSVLYRAAQEEQAEAQTAAAQKNAASEEALVRQVGSLVRSPSALEDYLSSQLPSYEERLRQNGADERVVRASSRLVRAQAVEDNICRSLSIGDWRSAQAALEKHGTALADTNRAACAAKTRAEFARSHAEKLWEQVRLETGGDAAQIHCRAAELVQDPDAELAALMRRTLASIFRRETAQEHLAAAGTLEAVVQASSDQAVKLLAGRNTLEREEWNLALRAAEAFDGDCTRSDNAFFVQCYFSGTAKEHLRAFKRGRVSARDYLRLEAARHRRESGEQFYAQELLCGGIDVWMRKKGFSAQDVARAQYAVLSAGAPAEYIGNVWKEVKNLLEV